jgi:hypothetical protein
MSTSESNKNINTNDIINSFFSNNSITLLLSFLAIYFIVFIIIKLFYDTSGNQNELPQIRNKILDLMIFGTLLFYLLNTYFNLSESDREKYLNHIYYNFKEFVEDKTSIFSVISFILGFYLCIYFLQIDMSYENQSSSIRFIDSTMWIVFIILLISDFFMIFFNISLIDLLDDVFRNREIDFIDSSGNDDSSGNYDSSGNDDSSGNKQYEPENEVFNVSNNLYTYEDAPEVCSLYGAKVATYEQVEEAYNKGGEWCNYGWSEGQLALFPTQKSTWSKLQGSEQTKNNCGRPGINGGYMENKNILFGVNCFGKKPAASKNDLAYMDANKEIVIPKSAQDSEVNAKIQMWQNNPDIFLKMNPFNRDQWNE